MLRFRRWPRMCKERNQQHETDTTTQSNRVAGVMSSRISILVLTLISLAGDRQVKSESSSFNGYDLVDKTGNIRKPEDYRDRYQSLGTYAVVDLKDDHELHAVWAPPGTAEYYRKTGKF